MCLRIPSLASYLVISCRYGGRVRGDSVRRAETNQISLKGRYVPFSKEHVKQCPRNAVSSGRTNSVPVPDVDGGPVRHQELRAHEEARASQRPFTRRSGKTSGWIWRYLATLFAVTEYLPFEADRKEFGRFSSSDELVAHLHLPAVARYETPNVRRHIDGDVPPGRGCLSNRCDFGLFLKLQEENASRKVEKYQTKELEKKVSAW